MLAIMRKKCYKRVEYIDMTNPEQPPIDFSHMHDAYYDPSTLTDVGYGKLATEVNLEDGRTIYIAVIPEIQTRQMEDGGGSNFRRITRHDPTKDFEAQLKAWQSHLNETLERIQYLPPNESSAYFPYSIEARKQIDRIKWQQDHVLELITSVNVYLHDSNSKTNIVIDEFNGDPQPLWMKIERERLLTRSQGVHIEGLPQAFQPSPIMSFAYNKLTGKLNSIHVNPEQAVQSDAPVFVDDFVAALSRLRTAVAQSNPKLTHPPETRHDRQKAIIDGDIIPLESISEKVIIKGLSGVMSEQHVALAQILLESSGFYELLYRIGFRFEDPTQPTELDIRSLGQAIEGHAWGIQQVSSHLVQPNFILTLDDDNSCTWQGKVVDWNGQTGMVTVMPGSGSLPPGGGTITVGNYSLHIEPLIDRQPVQITATKNDTPLFVAEMGIKDVETVRSVIWDPGRSVGELAPDGIAAGALVASIRLG
jgi:hypothetical protein